MSQDYCFSDDEDAEFYRDSQGCNCFVGVMVVGLMFFVFGCLIGYFVSVT